MDGGGPTVILADGIYYRQFPGVHPWIGDHSLGDTQSFMHAGSCIDTPHSMDSII